MQRKTWIDNLRGLCIIGILLMHTEVYYNGDNIIDYKFYCTNMLIAFFVISGYLFYKDKPFDIKRKIKSISKTILLPYFIFATITYFPKCIVHGSNVNIGELATELITGQLSWFVVALYIAEIVFSLLIHLSKDNAIFILTVSSAAFVASKFMSETDITYFWQADNVMLSLIFLCLGYYYHKKESFFNTAIRPLHILIMFIMLVLIKTYEAQNDMKMTVWHINITNYPLFLLDTTLSSIMLIEVFKRLPSLPLLDRAGRHSLVYYFFCGGVPLIVSKVFIRLGFPYNGNYLYVVASVIIVLIITEAISSFIYRYLPYTLGKW